MLYKWSCREESHCLLPMQSRNWRTIRGTFNIDCYKFSSKIFTVVSDLCIAEIVHRWQDLGMNLFWLGVGCSSLLIIHFLTLLFLRWRMGAPAHGMLSVLRFALFLLILMLPCICQSSAFVIRGEKYKTRAFWFRLFLSSDF